MNPLLCTVTQEPGHGGIARVAGLLWKVFQEVFAERFRSVTFIPDGAQGPTVMNKLRFARTVVQEQIACRVQWIMFDHLGLARVQSLVPRSRRRPYAVFLHSVEVWKPLSPSRRRVLREATVRIANSNHTAGQIAAAHPDVGPIEVCHLALLPGETHERGFPEARESSPYGAAREGMREYMEVDRGLLEKVRVKCVLIVGRMMSTERHKGHDKLIEAWPIVKARVPDAQMVIVGGGDDVERLRAAAQRAAFGNSILFTGHVTDGTLQAIYQRAGIFAMPSRGEGFGVVYLEAMQHRLPCIGSIHDAAREIIEHGVTGLLVDQGDIAGLTGAIVELLLNPSRRRELGQAGFERLQTVFSFERFRLRLLECLKPLLKDVLFST